MPQKETLDKAAYTCLLVFYRRLSPLFQFSLPGVTLVYLSQWDRPACTNCTCKVTNYIKEKGKNVHSISVGKRVNAFALFSFFSVIFLA